VIESDPLKVRQVILNLLSNAIKFTDQGSIRVAAKESADPPGVLLSVQDTGIGMREEDIPTIFDPFRQIDGSLTRQAGGTGLGLAIVKNILEVLQGKIEVESRLGVGSTFTVFFPQMEKECEKPVSEVERS
jgi:signal transduction histidine kinase